MLVIEILCTLGIMFSVAATVWSGLYRDARQYTSKVSCDYQATVEGYICAFQTMLIPIKDKIKDNLSFEEMQNWMQSNENQYTKAMGAGIYDGIAFTYKGGYAHSWNYGDYTNYDPSTRPWYQQAQKANGKIAVVAPYVTYLDPSYLEDDGYIIMTIAQKYNDEISFDLDLKINGIKAILQNSKLQYDNEKIFLYNKEGYILSSTIEKEFAHNLYQADAIISKDYVEKIKKHENGVDKLHFTSVDGHWQYIYFYEDKSGNRVCMMIPFREVFVHNFLVLVLISLLLILLEYYLYVQNRHNTIEFMERDRRLSVVADTIYKERLYVDIDRMEFYDNDRKGQLCKTGTYEELYQSMQSRLVEESEVEQLEAFLSPQVLKQCVDHQYKIETKRFIMTAQTKEEKLEEKTIQINRLAFTKNGTHMVGISMQDAAESADLLKAALKKTEQMQQDKAKEYNRFMGYICNAVDTVTELNVQDRTMVRYYMQDGELVSEPDTYPQNEWLLFHPDDRQEIMNRFSNEQLLEMCTENKAAYAECRIRWNHASQYRWCTAILQGIEPSKEKPFNFLLILKNTDELKKREKQQKKVLEDAFIMAKQASQAKGTFLSKMSHEIRTPLNAIIGYLSLAQDANGEVNKIKHCIDNGAIAAKHLLQIINDVLDMSSIESGRMKIANEEFDLKKEISEITTIFYQNAKSKGVRFEAQVDQVVEEWVIGDQLRLNQVLMNLLSNAVKFTPENGLVKLVMRQLNPESEGNEVYIQFTVSDTGIGMSKEYMSRLFEPFEQENANTARQYGGSGLGLSITKNLIHLMGGTIEVESQQRKGSIFTVTMHFGKAVEHHEKGIVPMDYSNVRALIVDDEVEEGTYVKAMLKRCGVKSDAVTDGEMALKRLKSRKGGDYAYDLCILDWHMPLQNGVEVANQIRKEFGDDIPIIIATAYDISEIEEKAKQAGVNKVVSKPLFQSTLFDLLVSSFGRYEPVKEMNEVAKVMDMKGVHVLLAEDNEMNMDIAVAVLEKAGIIVDQVVNGEQAVNAFLNAPAGTFDLVLMDVQMPLMDGYEATKAIRTSKHPEGQTIPIIAMTANAFAEDVAKALSSGMNAHIAKPINYDKMFEVLSKYRK